MGLGLKLRQGQRLGIKTMTKTQVMSMHFEMLVDAARAGAGVNGLSKLLGEVEIIVAEQLCDQIDIWFQKSGEEVAWLTFHFDWRGFNVWVSSGGPDVPMKINGQAYTQQLVDHANQLERMCREMKSRTGCDEVTWSYFYSDGAVRRLGREGCRAKVGAIPLEQSERNKRNAIKGHGVRVNSDRNPGLGWSFGLRKNR